MNKQYFFVDNLGVKIHCVQVNPNLEQIPLIIIPGAVNSLEDVEEDLKDTLLRYHIIISLRGRGQSSVPEDNYTIDDQSSDILSVLDFFNINEYYLFGHSLGSSIGIKACAKRVGATKGFIIGDFPTFYPPYDKNWASKVEQSMPNVSKTFLYGLAKDAKVTGLSSELQTLKCKILMLRAGQDSAIPDEIVPMFLDKFPNGTVEVLSDCDHDIFSSQKLIEKIEEFITQIEQENGQVMPI